MKNESKFLRYGLPLCRFLALFFLVLSFFSCTGTASPKNSPPAGTPAADDPVNTWNFTGSSYGFPGGLRFIPAPLSDSEEAGKPSPGPYAGVGTITREQRDLGAGLSPADKASLSAAFRDAYMEGLLRGLPLDGVLGGDHVHGWPIESPATWVQNWRSSEQYPNSWGIPSLILAIRGLSGGRVFIIHGAILDAYGKSSGLGGANGAAGYGAPRGEEYRRGDGIAQRFDFGLLVIDGSGKVIFLQEEAPSTKEPIPGGVGLLSSASAGISGADEAGSAFRSAWMSAVDRNFPALPNDGPVYHLDFSAFPWTLTGGSMGNLVLKGLYYQTFGEGKALFLLGESPAEPAPESPGPRTARVLTGPFLDALMTAVPPNGGQVNQFQSANDPTGRMTAHDRLLPGAEALAADPLPAGFTPEENAAFARALLGGIARYGFPLSDAVPQKTDSGQAWTEAQRFTRGWMTTAEE
ncbi:hypothetical protein AGMMS49546_36320 [Spirochaetia bacterium]|nr:hypothetical protein AGMMS49546_36320 [Spirochaetia bacterium]